MAHKYSRRGFLKTGSAAAALAALPATVRGAGLVGANRSSASNIFVPSDGRWSDPDHYDLVKRAVEAAKAAGATYADARITTTHEERIFGTTPIAQQTIRGFGVRALVGGFWGFVSSAVWTPDEAARLGRGAVAQARANSVGKTRELDLGPAPKPVTGEWVMPIKYDPFADVTYGEKLDYSMYVSEAIQNYMVGIMGSMNMQFYRQIKTVATSDGSLFRHTIYGTGANIAVAYRDQYSLKLPQGGTASDFLSVSGQGWERVTDGGIIDSIPQLVEDAEQSRHTVPFDIGRYDVVFNASSMATLIDNTLAQATELDRAMGYEANASGSSYIATPLDMVGTYQAGSSLLNLSGDCSTPYGIATAPCDDEGVPPVSFDIVKNGILVDFQTTREQAGWLASYYNKIGRPVRSNGCARAEGAMQTTMQLPPNIGMAPGDTSASFEDIVAGVDKGLAVVAARNINVDQRRLNGIIMPTMRQITKGKLGPYVVGGAIQFRSTDMWKNLAAIGGSASKGWFGSQRIKGQPGQRVLCSVGAVPGKFTGVAVVDAFKRA